MDSILYQRIKLLCNKHGIPFTKLLDDLGLSESTLRKWKTGTSPSADKVRMIADYFSVSTDYLIGRSEIQDTAETLVEDSDFISLQRARSKMSQSDKDRMMKMLRLAFDTLFDDEE